MRTWLECLLVVVYLKHTGIDNDTHTNNKKRKKIPEKKPPKHQNVTFFALLNARVFMYRLGTGEIYMYWWEMFTNDKKCSCSDQIRRLVR